MPNDAVNPAGGTAPEPRPITDEASAVAAITDMLNPSPDKQPPRKRPQADNQPDSPEDEPEDLQAGPEEEPEGEPEGEPESDEPANDTEDGALELPPTIAELTEALGVEPEKLMSIKVPVNIDGKVAEVTLSEAISGYQKDQDYRRKTEGLADERKTFHAHVQQAQAAFQQKTQTIDVMIQALQAELQVGPTRADLAQLITENPPEYIRQTQLLEERQERLTNFQRARAQQLQYENQARMAQISEFRQSQQQALLGRFPGIDDPQKGNALQAEVFKVLTDPEIGYGEDELKQYMGGAFDHRLIVLALKYNTLKQQQSKGKEAAKKIVLKPIISKPGASRGKKGASERQEELRNRLRRHGKDRTGTNRVRAEQDAVAYVRNILDG